MQKTKSVLKVMACAVAVLLALACEAPVGPGVNPTASPSASPEAAAEPEVPSVPVDAVSFSIASGSAVAPEETVTITTTTSGATIYYTIDGSEPTTSSTFGELDSSSASVKVASACTIKAIAVKAGMLNSSIGSASYTIDPNSACAAKFYAAAADMTPLSGTVSSDPAGNFVVYLKSETAESADVKYYYTIDGSSPDDTKTAYDPAVGIVLPPVTTKKSVSIKSIVVDKGAGRKNSVVQNLTVNMFPPNKIIFTEYFDGMGNNKYIEISNVGSETVDLSDYSILLTYVKDKKADSAKNAEKFLTGQLGAGMSVVYYNPEFDCDTKTKLRQNIMTNLFNLSEIESTDGSASWRVSVSDAKNITYFNGDDPLTLKRAGITVDQLGPKKEDTSFLTVWMAKGRLIRKPAATGGSAAYTSANWNRFSFIVGDPATSTVSANVAGDDYSAGSYLQAPAGKTLRTFAVNGMRADVSSNTINMELSSGNIKKIVPSFDTDAEYVKVAGTVQISCSTERDFTAAVSYVVGTAGDEQTYTVKIIIPPLVLTDVNYDFDGGLTAAVAKIGTSSTPVNIFDPSDTDVTLTGVVTSISGTSKFFIQDKNRGLCFYKPNAFTTGSIKVGDKVTVKSRQGILFTGTESKPNTTKLYEVTDFDAPIVSQGGRTIYAIDGNVSAWSSVDGNADSGETLNRIYKYRGIWKEDLSSANGYVGKFSDDGTVLDATRLYTNANSYKPVTAAPSPVATFYGIIDIKSTGAAAPYKYNKVMIIGEADQYRP